MLAKEVVGLPPRALPKLEVKTQLSGLEPYTFGIGFTMIGERTNITGSPKFWKLILNGDFEGALAVSQQQGEGGASIIDITMDEGMIGSEESMKKFLNRVAPEKNNPREPVMGDRSRWTV